MVAADRFLMDRYADEGQNVLAMFNADMIGEAACWRLFSRWLRFSARRCAAGYKQPDTEITLGYMNRFADMDLTLCAWQIAVQGHLEVTRLLLAAGADKWVEGTRARDLIAKGLLANQERLRREQSSRRRLTAGG